MEIIPLGDSALVVRAREQFEDAPEETLEEVLRVFQLLQRAAIPGVIELAPAYTSVAVFFDPVEISKASGKAHIFDWLKGRFQAALDINGDSPPSGSRRRKRPRTPAHRARRAASRVVDIPVCYDAAFAPDLGDVARYSQ